MNRFGAFVPRVGRAGVGTLVVPLLAAYLFFGGCGAGKKGFVLGARAWGVTVTAAWCSA
jgi:hypothetical protein